MVPGSLVEFLCCQPPPCGCLPGLCLSVFGFPHSHSPFTMPKNGVIGPNLAESRIFLARSAAVIRYKLAPLPFAAGDAYRMASAGYTVKMYAAHRDIRLGWLHDRI